MTIRGVMVIRERPVMASHDRGKKRIGSLIARKPGHPISLGNWRVVVTVKYVSRATISRLRGIDAQAKLTQQLHIGSGSGVFRGQEFVSEKDRVCAGEETERLA